MIGVLPDGRELQLPDSLTDDQADVIVHAIMAAEKGDQMMKAAAAQMVNAMATMRDDELASQRKIDPAVAELRKLNEGVARLYAATMADTVVIQRDGDGSGIRSKKIINTQGGK